MPKIEKKIKASVKKLKIWKNFKLGIKVHIFQPMEFIFMMILAIGLNHKKKVISKFEIDPEYTRFLGES